MKTKTEWKVGMFIAITLVIAVLLVLNFAKGIKRRVEDWLDWSQGKVATYLWDFINNNHGHLEHKDEFEPNKKYPSRRSWDRFSQTVAKANLFGETPEFGLLFNVATGFVGFEAAVAFKDFIANYDRQVSIEDILIKGDFSKLADFGINDHTAIIDKLSLIHI